MQIKSLSFSNYKAFFKEQVIDIKPITVLIGKNSSGKSSIAKLFTLLENSLSGVVDEPLLYNNNNVTIGGEFRDLVYNRQPNLPVSFSITFDDGTILKVSVLSDNSNYKLTISEWEISSSDLNISLRYSPLNGYTDNTGAEYKCDFKGFIPINIIGEDEKNLILKGFIEKFRINVDYIGPFRIVPDRQFQLIGKLNYGKTGVKGEFAYPILAVSEIQKSELHKKVGLWFKEHFTGWAVKVKHNNPPFFEILLEKDEVDINIVDVGQGMNQALPLVVRSFIEKENSLIVLEQPELHLHPAAHAELAELFARSALENNQTFIIETHSENLILRLRRLIVDNDFNMKPEDVGIYWIDDSDLGGQEITSIQINSKGELSDWPEGVFNENLEEIIEIKKALKEKNKSI